MHRFKLIKVAVLAASLHTCAAQAQCETDASAKSRIAASEKRMPKLNHRFNTAMETILGYSQLRAKDLGWDDRRYLAFFQSLLADDTSRGIDQRMEALGRGLEEAARKVQDLETDGNYKAACLIVEQTEPQFKSLQALTDELVQHARSGVEAMKK